MDRLLIIAPKGRDAKVIQAQLGAAQIIGNIVKPDELLQAIESANLGAAIITDDALSDAELAALGNALQAQPPWSDCPFILLTPRYSAARTVARVSAALGNVTALECPLHPTALLTAARAALRARDRQRRAQDYLADRDTLALALEARVVARTTALERAIEERATAQELLDESLANYRYTIELSTLIPWTASATGWIVSIGQAWRIQTGATAQEMTRGGFLRWFHPDDIDSTNAVWEDAISRAVPIDHRNRIRAPDASYRWMRWRAAPRFAPDGTVLRWYGTVEDIDEQHAAESHLQQVQADLIHVSRLSAMGTLASTIAHELNQPLLAIANYVRGCRRLADRIHVDLRQEFTEALTAADHSATRAGEIVRRLRNLVSRGDVARLPEDLPTLINEACGIAMLDASTLGIVYQTHFDTNAQVVLVDRIQVQQVIINLVRNAVESLAGAKQRAILIETFARPQGFFEIAIHDSGPGLDAAGQAQLFKPFTTSKRGGMGIGLSISRTIVEAHGGHIWYEPGFSGGATFRFTLPAPDEYYG